MTYMWHAMSVTWDDNKVGTNDKYRLTGFQCVFNGSVSVSNFLKNFLNWKPGKQQSVDLSIKFPVVCCLKQSASW